LANLKTPPLLLAIIHQGIEKQVFKSKAGINADEISQFYLTLIIGDIQVQRVIGVKDILKLQEIENRSTLALNCIKHLTT
jgi:hypothetical protein